MTVSLPFSIPPKSPCSPSNLWPLFFTNCYCVCVRICISISVYVPRCVLCVCVCSLHNGTCMYVLRVAIGHQTTSWYAVPWEEHVPPPPHVPFCRLTSHGLSLLCTLSHDRWCHPCSVYVWVVMLGRTYLMGIASDMSRRHNLIANFSISLALSLRYMSVL